MENRKLNDIKKTLAHLNDKELTEICLSLIRYKKENKELVSYLLYHKHDEPFFIEKLCADIDLMFTELDGLTTRDTRKKVRKIIRHCDKWIRFSKRKDTEIEVRIHLLKKIRIFPFSRSLSYFQETIYLRQRKKITQSIPKVHEDLQNDYLDYLEEFGL